MGGFFRFVIISVLIATLCGALWACSSIAGAVMPSAAQAAPQGIMAAITTQTAPAQPAPTATATPDALHIEQQRAELAAALAEEQAAKVRLDMVVRDAAETEVYYNAIHAQETERAQAQATATAAEVGRATQVQRSIIMVATQSGAATATAQAPRDEAERKIAAMLPDLFVVGVVLVTAIALVLAFLAGWWLWEKIITERQWREPEADPEPAQVAYTNSLPVMDVTPLEYSDTVIVGQFARYGIPLETLQYVAGEVLNGRPLSYEEFTPKENGLSDGQMKTFQGLALKYRFAEWKTPGEHKPGMTPTTAGVSFFERVTGRETTHPLAQDAQETPKTAQNDR